MKTTGKAGKELLARLAPLKAGDKLEFDGPLFGLGTPVDAYCVETEDDRFWQFSLYFHSVHVQDVVVEKQGDLIVFDTLG